MDPKEERRKRNQAKKARLDKMLEGMNEKQRKKFLARLAQKKQEHEIRKSLAQGDAPTPEQTAMLAKAAKEAEQQRERMRQAMLRKKENERRRQEEENRRKIEEEKQRILAMQREREEQEKMAGYEDDTPPDSSEELSEDEEQEPQNYEEEDDIDDMLDVINQTKQPEVEHEQLGEVSLLKKIGEENQDPEKFSVAQLFTKGLAKKQEEDAVVKQISNPLYQLLLQASKKSKRKDIKYGMSDLTESLTKMLAFIEDVKLRKIMIQFLGTFDDPSSMDPHEIDIDKLLDTVKDIKVDHDSVKELVEKRFNGNPLLDHQKKALEREQELKIRERVELTKNQEESQVKKINFLDVIQLFDSIQAGSLSYLLEGEPKKDKSEEKSENDSTTIDTDEEDSNSQKKSMYPLNQYIDQENEADVLPLTLMRTDWLTKILSEQAEGQLTSIAKSKSLHVVGTSKGEILEINAEKKVRKFTIPGMVLTVDISPSEKIWAAGSSESIIFVKKVAGWSKKTDKTMMDKQPITAIRFCDDKEFIVTTRVDAKKVKVKSIKISYELMPIRIFKMNVFDISHMVTHKRADGTKIVIISSLDIIHVAVINKEGIDYLGNIIRPPGVEKGWLPLISWMEKKSSFLVLWKNTSLLYMIKGKKVIEIANKTLPYKVLWGSFIEHNVVVMVDYSLNIIVQTVEDLCFENDSELTEKQFFGKIKLQGAFKIAPWKIATIAETSDPIKTIMEKIRKVENKLVYISGKSIVEVAMIETSNIVKNYYKKKIWGKGLNLAGLVLNNKIFSTSQGKKVTKNIAKFIAIDFLKEKITGSKEKKFLISVAIDGLLRTGNNQAVYNEIAQYSNPKMFWDIILDYINAGRLNKTPALSLAKSGTFLDDEVLHPLLMNLDIQGNDLETELFQKMLRMIKNRNMIVPLARLGLMYPKHCLGVYLEHIFDSVKQISAEAVTGINHKIKERKLEEITEDHLENIQKAETKFTRMFWFLYKLLNWNSMSSVSKTLKKQHLYEATVEWILEKSNFKRLALINIQILLELLYQIFMDFEFVSKPETKDFLFSIWNERLKERPKEKTKAWMVSNNDFADKLLLLICFDNIQAYNESQEEIDNHMIDFSFLFAKLLNLSMFKDLVNETEWFKLLLVELCKMKFLENRFWLLFTPIGQNDYEENILRAIDNSKLDDEFLRQFSRKAERAGYLRVGGFLGDRLFGPYQSLKIHLKNFHYNKDHYVYDWALRKIKSFPEYLKEGGDRQQIELFTKEIVSNVKELDMGDKQKCRQLILLLELTPAQVLRHLGLFPDIQVEFFEKLLMNQKRGTIFDDDAKLKYLELKCDFAPDAVSFVLEEYHFPLSEALVICNEKKNYFGAAFVKARLGKTKEAITEYLRIIALSCQNFITGELEKRELYISDAEYAFQRINQLCLLMLNEDKNDCQETYKKVLKTIVTSYTIINRRRNKVELNIPKRFRAWELRRYIKVNFIKDLLVSMVKYNTKDLPKMINEPKYLGGLEIGLSTNLLQMLTNDMKMISDVQNIASKDHSKNKTALINLAVKSSPLTGVCEYCDKLFISDESDSLSLSCGHSYHFDCAEKLGKTPKDVDCVTCSPDETLTRKFLSKIERVTQPTIDLISQKRQEERNKIKKVAQKSENQLGFERLKSHILEHKGVFMDCTKMVLGASFFAPPREENPV